MNQEEFMRRLEELLEGIPSEEKEEALSYYRSYFEDAGAENEAKVIEELESPEKLAASIREGLQEDMEAGEYTENGYRTGADTERMETASYVKDTAHDGEGTAQTAYAGASQDRTVIIVLSAIVAVLTFPVWGGVLAGVAGVLLGIFGALAGVMIGFVAGGFACIGVGIGQLCMANVPTGILLIGIGALLTSFGILALWLLVLFCGRFLPYLVRGIVKLIQNIFRGRRREN